MSITTPRSWRSLPLAVLGMVLALVARLPGADDPYLAVTVDQAILRFTPDQQTRTTVTVTPQRFPRGASLSYAWRQIQDHMSPLAVSAADHQVVFGDARAASTTVTLPGPGVYALRVTVTDLATGATASRNTWISVWDHASRLLVDGQPDPLALAPGIAPPPRVRDLTPDPGPFHHPRLLVTDADWEDVNTRAVQGQSKIANNSYVRMKNGQATVLDPATPKGQLAAQLETYADAGFTGPQPDLALGDMDPTNRVAFARDFITTIRNLAFVAWMEQDPRMAAGEVPAEVVAVRRRLAKLVAAYSRVLLAAYYNIETGTFITGSPRQLPGVFTTIAKISANCHHPIGVEVAYAYDFISPWMTATEARHTRNLLFAVAAGRETLGRGYVQVINGVLQNRGVARGPQQNGNFASFADHEVLQALVVAGEESGADATVIRTFLQPPKPADYHLLDRTFAYDKTSPVAFDGGRPHDCSRPYPLSMQWPFARKADVDNLQRSIWWNQDGGVSAWGFIVEREAYHATSTDAQWPAALACARYGGHNQFVTGYFYHIINQILWHQAPFGSESTSPNFRSHVTGIAHHAGAGGTSRVHRLLLKYMYPDDPAVDYFISTVAPHFEKFNSVGMEFCLWGMDPTYPDPRDRMEAMATAKQLPLTKLDPEEGMVVMRSGWKDEDLQIDLDAGFKNCGHMNAEKNGFALVALERSWSLPNGFHKVYSGWYSTVQFQNAAWSDCPYTQGYVGINPNYPAQDADYDQPHNFPTPPGRLVECREGNGGRWALAVGDATVAYRYRCSGEGNRVSKPRKQFMYPGLFDDVVRRCGFLRGVYEGGRSPYYGFIDQDLSESPGTAVEYAYRSILLMRGTRPYVLMIDDIERDGQPANWRWIMSNRSTDADGQFSMQLKAGATSDEAVLYHRQDTAETIGNPRLLVRELSGTGSGQPAMRMDQTAFTSPVPADFYLNETPNRLFLDRNTRVKPGYEVLLMPHRVGEALPVTTWNADHTQLTIAHGDGTQDVIALDRSQPDHRTRLTVVGQGVPVPEPVITAVTPATGSATGGTPLTITGSRFTGTTAVVVGGQVAANVVVVNDTTLTCLTPAGAGTVALSVATPVGVALKPRAFTFSTAPTISAVSPATGGTVGGMAVTITGTALAGATSVTFGGVPATDLVVRGSTSILCVAPALPASTVDVVVTTPYGSVTRTGAYTAVLALGTPTVTAVTPASGSTSGGYGVTITGLALAGPTAIFFGAVPAANVRGGSNTSLTCTVPAQAAGTVSISFMTYGGLVTLPAAFTYVAPAPTLTAVSPVQGPVAGGATLTLTGTGLAGATGVLVGGVPATGLRVVTPTSVTCVSPPGVAGTAAVTLTTAGGTASLAAGYRYVHPAPTITSVTPSHGATTGGTILSLAGTALTGTTQVTIGGVALTNLRVVSATAVTGVVPAGAAGAAALVVSTSGGTASSTFRYVQPPAITSVLPATGPVAGGTSLTLGGSRFTGAEQVLINGIQATAVTVVNDTTLSCISPEGMAGPATVAVVLSGGISGAEGGLFSYRGVPALANVSPVGGTTLGGTVMTITGLNFNEATTVTFRGTPATEVVVVSDGLITCRSPAGGVGIADVAITGPGGTGTRFRSFTYGNALPPTITGTTPAVGPMAGDTLVTITGTALAGTSRVTIGGLAATQVTVVDATTVTCRTPAGMAGAARVAVTAPGGTVTLEAGFTYQPPQPAIEGIVPPSGPVVGGTPVIITGQNLWRGPQITFGSVPALAVTVLDEQTLSCIAPPGAAGPVALSVGTDGGTQARAAGFTYVASSDGGGGGSGGGTSGSSGGGGGGGGGCGLGSGLGALCGALALRWVRRQRRDLV